MAQGFTSSHGFAAGFCCSEPAVFLGAFFF
jgi:hypothetical protein